MNIYGVNQYMATLFGQTPIIDLISADNIPVTSITGDYRYVDSLLLDINFFNDDGSSISTLYGALSRKTQYELAKFGYLTYDVKGFTISTEKLAESILSLAWSLWDGTSEGLSTISDIIQQSFATAGDTLAGTPWLKRQTEEIADLIYAEIDKLIEYLKENETPDAA